MALPMLGALRAVGLPAARFGLVDKGLPHVVTEKSLVRDQPTTLITRCATSPTKTPFCLAHSTLLTHRPAPPHPSVQSNRHATSPDCRNRVPDQIALIDGLYRAHRSPRAKFGSALCWAVPQAAFQLHNSFLMPWARIFTSKHRSARDAVKVLTNLLAASHTTLTRLVPDRADAAGLDERKLIDLIGANSGPDQGTAPASLIPFSFCQKYSGGPGAGPRPVAC